MLWSDHAFDPLRDKVSLGEEKPTSPMLTNTERLRPEDKPLADLAIKTLERCRAAHAAILPRQVNTLILGFQRRQDALIAELYVGKITFGEYNVNMNRINGEVAAQWLFEATHLNKRAIELDNTGRHSEAEPLYQESLAMREEVLGPDHPDVAVSLNNLAFLYGEQGRYSEAEPLCKRSLAIWEKAFGPDHLNVATALINLATLYQHQGRYVDAEPLFKRSLAINETVLGPDHPTVALSSNNLALLYQDQGRFADAEPLYKRALAISEKALDPTHPNVAKALNRLAGLYGSQGRYTDAEPLYKRSLAIGEKTFGPDHPSVAKTLNNLALLYFYQGRYADAEPLYKRSLAIWEKALGPDHPDIALSLNNLSNLYQTQGRYADAEPLYKRALAINEKALGPDHPAVASSLKNLASLYQDQGRYADAEPLYKRALTIREKALGPIHPDVAELLSYLAGFYETQGRYADAERLYKRALEIYETALGPDHRNVAIVLNNLAILYHHLGRYADAEPLYKRSLAIKEKSLGPDHPDVATSLNALAFLYNDQGRYSEAEPLYKRSLAIWEKAFSPDHPSVATALNNLAILYYHLGRYADAELQYKGALAIAEKALGPDHPNVASTLNNLAWLYQAQGRYADALPFVKRTISQNNANKSIAFAVLYGAENQKLIAPAEALNASYTVLQRSVSSAAGEAISKLEARFAAGTDELAKLVRKDQDLTAEADRLDKSIIAAVSKPPAERNQAMEEQIRKRIDEIKSERGKLQDVFNRRFSDYVALSKPQPLIIDETQPLLADDEALVVFNFDVKSYAWIVTRTDAGWIELKVTAKDLDTHVKRLRQSLTSDNGKPFDAMLSYKIYHSTFGAIADKIESKKRLSFITNGALTSLPLQLLITKDPTGKKLRDVDWLVRSYATTVLPSVASLKVLRTRAAVAPAAKPMIAFADPVFSKTARMEARQRITMRGMTSFVSGTQLDIGTLAEDLPQLPSTRDEVQTIAKTLQVDPSDIKLGLDATVTAVKEAKLHQYRVVYFATHGLVAGDLQKFSKGKVEPALALTIPDKPTEFDNGLFHLRVDLQKRYHRSLRA